MNVAIFGDSFANGVSDCMVGLSHSGLTQYLLDDGHIKWAYDKNSVLHLKSDLM